VITTGVKDGSFDWNDKYNIWSGVIGGFFLALSYFGTDQSQVGRYLTAKNTTESKVGLLINGLVKVPMQFCILLIGALLFTFYQFQPSPVFFNRAVEQKALATSYKDSMIETNKQYNYLKQTQTQLGLSYIRTKDDSKEAIALKDSLQAGNKKLEA
jgi:SSS family solute:Na+ symporter